jgi:response regulator RpfG family c-di-GMP phosphodiesterase
MVIKVNEYKNRRYTKLIKYANIDGYTNLGEVQMFSHLYQWIEKVNESPKVILITAYEEKQKVFKGYIYTKSKQYKSIPIDMNELKEVKNLVGKIEQVDFKEFIVDTLLDNEYYNSFQLIV